MRILIFKVVLLISASVTYAPKAHESEMRCGWFENPTPANIWFTDRDGEWLISVQGGYQAEVIDWPNFSEQQWVKINNHYGYGCVCLEVEVDHQAMRIINITKAAPRPLLLCREDKNLKEPF